MSTSVTGAVTASTAYATQGERLSRTVLLTYCTAQFGLSALNTLMNTRLLYFYTNVLELAGTTFGWIMLIGKLWDAVTDPGMGHITDNTRWRIGRRRPFFAIGAPCLGIGLWLLFSPPAGRTGAAVAPWLLLMFLAVFTSRTVYETPYQAMIPDITRDYGQRTRLATYRATIGNMGDFTGAMLPVLLVMAGLTWGRSLSISSLGIGIVVILTAGAAMLGTRERTDVSHLPKKPFLPNMKDILMYPVRNRPARILIFSYACAVFATAMPVATFTYLNEFVFLETGLENTFVAPYIAKLGGNHGFLDMCVLLAYFGGVFTGAPIWMRAMRSRDKKPAYIFAFLYLGSLLCLAFFIPRNLGILFPALNFFVGAGALGLWMLPQAIGPDCIEYEELHHGERHEGGFYGIWSFVQKAGGGVALLTMGFLLDAIGFIPKAVQTDGTVLGLRFLYAGTPLLICLAATLVFSRYPITREVYDDIMRQLEKRHADAQEQP